VIYILTFTLLTRLVVHSCVFLVNSGMRLTFVIVDKYPSIYHSGFNPKRVAEISHILLKTYKFYKMTYEGYCRRDRWQAHRRLIAVYLRCECCYSFRRLLQYPWKKGKGAILWFCPGHNTRPDYRIIMYKVL
jgi:hypothetical protein